MDDVSLLRQAQQGDVEAFGQLYERYVASVMRFLSAHLDERRDAEDLTADVFLQTWRSLPNYQQRGVPFQAYLMRVARNRLIDHYRRPASRRPTQSLDSQLGLTSPESGPAESALSNLEHQELRRVMALLREEHRTVLLLRFVENLSPQETAQAMQRSVIAVRVLQHRALNALRAALKTEEGEE